MKARAILKFLLFHKKMDKSHFIFSHFLISKHLNFLQIKIFFYFIPWSKLLRRYNWFLVKWVRFHFVPPYIPKKYFYWSSLHRLKLNEKYRKWIFEDIYRKYFPNDKWDFENENYQKCIFVQGLNSEIQHY